MKFSEDLKKKILIELATRVMSYRTFVEILNLKLVAYLDDVEHILQQLSNIQSEIDYKLSDNQLLFIHIALQNNLDLSYDYSGRGMFGKQCPSIVGEDTDTKYFSSIAVKTDSMGKYDTVIYAQY